MWPDDDDMLIYLDDNEELMREDQYDVQLCTNKKEECKNKNLFYESRSGRKYK